MNNDTTISLKGLNIGYNLKKNKQKIVASDINAELYSGQLTCLIGANGIGKSTLLRTIAAFQRSLSGDIIINNVSIRDYSNTQLAKIISVVLTTKLDNINMTVTEMVGMGRSPYTGFWGTLTKKDNQIVEESIEMVGIKHLSNRKMQTLSDGERQKVMIAKALAQQTPIIVLDEPTAFLDYPSKVDMMLLLRRLCKETGKTIFLSTHDIELALQTSDKLWLMSGEKLIVGSPKDLSKDGSLNTFLNHEGISFDNDNMIIKINTHE